MSQVHEIPLPGLDGSNPLGFLAALGTWRTTESIHPGTRMYWKPLSGHWAPVLIVPEQMSHENLVSALHDLLLSEGRLNTVFHVNKDLKIPLEKFRNKAFEILNENDIELSFWISALGSDVCVDKWGNIQGSSLDLMNAGKQYFLETIKFLIENTSLADLKNTLFEKWSYSNKRGGMRWDIEEDRRYALRWKDPQADTTTSQWGANRLAIEALPLMQTAPEGGRLKTTGFVSRGKKNTYFFWPIWSCPISIDIFKSVIGYVTGIDSTNTPTFQSMGIDAVFRSQRIWKGNPPNDYSNFCPATQIN